MQNINCLNLKRIKDNRTITFKKHRKQCNNKLYLNTAGY